MNIDDFITKYYPDTAKIRTNELRNWLEWINSGIWQEPLEKVLQNKSSIMKILTSFSTVSFSKTYYYRIKDYILNLADYLGITSVPIPSLNEFVEQQETNFYFKNLQEIFDLIDNVGKELFPDYYPNIDLVNIKSFVILGWKGLTPEQIPFLKKADLVQEDHNYFLYVNKNTKIQLTEKEFTILSNQAKALQYRSLPSGAYVDYKDSEFLFSITRQITGTEPYIKKNRIFQFIKAFNDVAEPRFNKTITFSKLPENALFDELIHDCSPDPLSTKIRKRTNASPNLVTTIKIRFQKWKDTYYTDTFSVYYEAGHTILPDAFWDRWDSIVQNMLENNPQHGKTILDSALNFLDTLLKSSDPQIILEAVNQLCCKNDLSSQIILTVLNVIKDQKFHLSV